MTTIEKVAVVVGTGVCVGLAAIVSAAYIVVGGFRAAGRLARGERS